MTDKESLLRKVIAELRDKHTKAEAMFPWNTKAEYEHREHLTDEFNLAAWNHVPFVLDQLESLLGKQTHPKYCPDPDSCEYSDCPTAFCDKPNKD